MYHPEGKFPVSIFCEFSPAGISISEIGNGFGRPRASKSWRKALSGFDKIELIKMVELLALMKILRSFISTFEWLVSNFGGICCLKNKRSSCIKVSFRVELLIITLKF